MNPPVPDPQPPAPGFYVHVPFCRSKCAYCDFCSVPLDRAGPGAVAHYLEALEREIDGLPGDFAPRTVFVGGGTPTALAAGDLARLLRLAARPLRGRPAAEWSVEANPGTLTPARLEALRAGGADRLSIGAQSFDPARLRLLGRAHTAADIPRAFAAARAAGFGNIGLDLIHAVPGQARAELQRDLERALALGPEHVSVYALSLEEGTPLAARAARGDLPAVEDEEARDQFEALRATLGAAGYEHYELSNFARPGFACRHNLLYWSGGEYLGAGPAAHSHRHGARWGNLPSPAAWAGAVAGGRSPRAFEERLDPEAHARETLVFGLRRLAGWDRAAFRRLTGFDYEALRGPQIRRLAGRGLLERDARGLRLADRALFVSDAVFAELV